MLILFFVRLQIDVKDTKGQPEVEELHAAHNEKLQALKRQNDEQIDGLKRELKATQEKLASVSQTA